jgi:BirA family biotin operon repressor/biotin-[acetyl-CoA-carboxylase] ligase
MASTQTLLAILSDGEFHSGEDIGASLGVSRAAVWKQLKKLEALDIPVHSIKGRGYRLPEAVQLLNMSALEEQGCPVDKFSSFDVQLSLDSTNNHMMKVAEENGLQRHICFAEMQTSGRGRRGRTWVSPFARNLYFSMLWPFSQGIAAIQGLSLAVGLAIHRAINELGVGGAQLKWPNDILAKDANGFSKLGGILIELTGDMSDACQVVIGVGLNLDVRIQDMTHIDQAAIGLKQLGSEEDRNVIAATVVSHLVDMLEQFEKEGFASLTEEWNEANAYKNVPVRLVLPSSEIPGVCQGVNEKGELVLQTETGLQVFNAGEVSLRLGEAS